ncbi:MAG: ROK family protein [Clostridia bacterium]|nr:ROK family protein [Clostridia bacterium]
MYKIGVDLGGTNISVGVVNEKYEIVGKASVPTNAGRPAADIFDDISATVKAAVADAGISMDQVESVGVGTPGSVDKSNGYITFANNLDFHDVPAKDMLEERIGKPVYLDNDANCAALGEQIAGVGNGVNDFIAVTLGTGVGSGIIIDGKILNGINGAAAEMGHMVICVDGIQCSCGRKGCWEKYASATALISQTKDAMQNNPDSLMWKLVDGDINKVSGRTSFDAMRQGDDVAKAVVDKYIYYVSVGISNIINTFQPEIVCVGGGISNENETLLQPIRDNVKKEVYTKDSDISTKILKAQLGNNAGVIGSALLKY